MVTMLEPKQKLGGVDILLHQELGNFERDFCDFNEARKKSTIVVVISGILFLSSFFTFSLFFFTFLKLFLYFFFTFSLLFLYFFFTFF